MSLEHLDPDEVIALRFSDRGLAEQLAQWCDGGLLGDAIAVPAATGLQLAHVGDWLVHDARGDFRVLTHEQFALRYGPGDG